MRSHYWVLAGLGLVALPALAQTVTLPLDPPPQKPAPALAQATPQGTPQSGAVDPANLPATPPRPAGPAVLTLRGLDKITGRPTDIIAPVGKPVQYKTLTITVRYCYSTPESETPETVGFVQIEDHPPDQASHRVFSGWMYASSPGLNALQHPIYDVWVLSCNTNAPGQAPATVAASEPEKVAAPSSDDKEEDVALPEGAGQ